MRQLPFFRARLGVIEVLIIRVPEPILIDHSYKNTQLDLVYRGTEFGLIFSYIKATNLLKSDKDYTAKYKRRAFETQRIYHAGYTEDDSNTFDRFIAKGISLKMYLIFEK